MRRLVSPIAILGIAAGIAAGAEPALRLDGEDLVLDIPLEAPGRFQVRHETGALRVLLPAETPEPDLELPVDPRLLITDALWETTAMGPSVLLELGAGALRSVEAEEGRLRVTITPSIIPRDAYVIGPKDVLDIQVFGEDDLSGTVTVDPAGNLRLLLIGAVPAAGLTTTMLAERIREVLEAEFLQDPRVRVEVAEYRSHSVTILGPVVAPGNIPVLGPTPLSKLIREVRGFTGQAGHTLTVRRELEDGSSHAFDVDREDIEKGRSDPLILPDDLITVAELDIFFIDGEVAKAQAYGLPPGLTLMKAIALAGGTSTWADETEVEIHREVGGEAILETYNLKKIRAHRAPDPEVRAGDLIRVPRRFL